MKSEIVHDNLHLVTDLLLHWNGMDEELLVIIPALLTYIKQVATMNDNKGWDEVVKSLPLFVRPKLGFYGLA
jgi:hypothetical protein